MNSAEKWRIGRALGRIGRALGRIGRALGRISGRGDAVGRARAACRSPSAWVRNRFDSRLPVPPWPCMA